MRYRLLGQSGLRVSDLFLGTMNFGGEGWGPPPADCRAMLDAYAEAGGNVIDTAVNYTDGTSEKIIGDLISSDDRDRFVVSTKYTVSTDRSDPNAAGNHRKNLTRSLETSLRQLKTDRIDLYWVHIWDARTPLTETMRALDDAVSAGKILYVGFSDAPAWVVARAQTIAEWRGWTPLVAIQAPYSLVRRDIERELLPMARSLGLSVAAWSPLARGALSGRFTESTTERGGSLESITERELGIARVTHDVAEQLGVTTAQVALAWTRARDRFVHPIVGARDVEQLRSNLGAAALELPADALCRLDEASAITLGFPEDFIHESRSFVYGDLDDRVAT